MEPVDLIETEIPEDLLREVLIRTYPRKSLVFRGISAFVLIVCATVLLSMEIYVYARFHYNHEDSQMNMIMAIIFLFLGLFLLVNVVRMPRVNTEKWMKNLRMKTGKSSMHLKLQFLEEELIICNMDIQEDLHIPYDYIHTIYVLGGVMVLESAQGRINIMRKDIPKEEEFTQWILSKCGRVKLKNIVK